MIPKCIVTFYPNGNPRYLFITEDKDIIKIMEHIENVEFHKLFYFNQVEYVTSNTFNVSNDTNLSIVKFINELTKKEGGRFLKKYDSFDFSFPESFLKQQLRTIKKCKNNNIK